MRCLNQTIARHANLEDKCTGKFWESGFKSQPLKSEEALLSCMAYVGLNPVCSGVAASPGTSDYTSIKERIHPVFKLSQAIGDQQESGDLLDFRAPLKPLLGFEGEVVDGPQSRITFAYQDYLELLDWSGRVVRDDKRGFIDKALPPILARLHIAQDRWRINVTQFELIHARRFNGLKQSIDTGQAIPPDSSRETGFYSKAMAGFGKNSAITPFL